MVDQMLVQIRAKMQQQSLTQTALANRCGFAQATVSAYLSGAKEPGITNLAKLAAAVGCVWQLGETPKK